MGIVNYSFTADTQSSGEIKARDNELIALSLDFTTGSGSMTIVLQRKIGGGEWKTLDTYTGDTEINIEAVTRYCAYRCTTTAYTTGTTVMNMAAPG